MISRISRIPTSIAIQARHMLKRAGWNGRRLLFKSIHIVQLYDWQIKYPAIAQRNDAVYAAIDDTVTALVSATKSLKQIVREQATPLNIYEIQINRHSNALYE